MKTTEYKRYGIDFNRLVCQLVPHWLRGKNIVLFLQACVSPMQSLSDSFRQWAEQTRIDVSMTSQIIKLEWYFARMYGAGKVRVCNYFSSNNPCYYRDALNSDKFHMPCYNRSQSFPSILIPVNYMNGGEISGVSFVVEVTSSLSFREAEIRRVIDKYKTVNKTYKIVYV